MYFGRGGRWQEGDILHRKKPPRGDFKIRRAGDGNRTHVSSLEGWCSTIELHPHESYLVCCLVSQRRLLYPLSRINASTFLNFFHYFPSCSYRETENAVFHKHPAKRRTDEISFSPSCRFPGMCWKQHSPLLSL